MQSSEQINELGTALAAAQSGIGAAKKDQSNPYFKSKYADLASVMAVSRDPLARNGLSVIQCPEIDDGYLVLETMLLHESGQFVTSTLRLEIAKPGPQEVGSLITYARRYALAAIVGVAPEDDDAEAAEGRQEGKPVEPKPQRADTAKTIAWVKQATDLSGLMAAIAKLYLGLGEKKFTKPQFSNVLMDAYMHGLAIAADDDERETLGESAHKNKGELGSNNYETFMQSCRQAHQEREETEGK